jgi:5-methylcytosine-specific restriction endonuclease McrA
MRVTYDNSGYYEAKAKLPNPDGKHCIICGGDLPPKRRKYCHKKCELWYRGVTKSWQITRDNVLSRDGSRCTICGATDSLEVHHTIQVKDGGDVFDESICVTLCKTCHKDQHSVAGRIRRQHIPLTKFIECEEVKPMEVRL